MVQRNNNNRIAKNHQNTVVSSTKKALSLSLRRRPKLHLSSPSFASSARAAEPSCPPNAHTNLILSNQSSTTPNFLSSTSRSNSDFSVSSSSLTDNVLPHVTRIPNFAGESLPCSLPLFDAKRLKEQDFSVKSRVPRQVSLLSSHMISQDAPTNPTNSCQVTLPEVTPLPFARAARSLEGTPMVPSQSGRSYSLSSTGTCMTETTQQQRSGPNSATTASTIASLRDRYISVKDTKKTSLVSTPSTIDTIRMLPRKTPQPKVTRSYLHLFYSTFFILLFFSCCIFGFAVLFLTEFTSERCWTTVHKSHPQQREITCNTHSFFRLVPRAFRSHLNLQIDGPEVQGFSKFPVNKLIQDFAIHSVHLYLSLLYRFLESISLPQQISYYLRKLGENIDGDSVLLRQPEMLTPLDLMHGIQQRIAQFESSQIIESELKNSSFSQSLRSHSNEFRKRIEHAFDNVYVAIGYGLANVIIIDTKEGLILFDTLENPINMRRMIQDWTIMKSTSLATTSNKYPTVIAIVYSHFHPDHVFGASAVYEPSITQIWAHEMTDAEIRKVFIITAGTTYKRSMRQFGTLITEDDGYINAGIGLRLDYNATEVASAIRPTHIWKGDRKTIEIAGETLELIHAPGETPDQSIVWLPKKQLLFGADNIYKSFPNIYAIRGTESRDAMVWVRSLDLMRKLKPETLVLGHTGILRGKELIYSTITAYRDGIQYIHDQTVRLMNKGHPVNDIVEIVKLPPSLRDHPYLQPYYGTVPWAVRAVFQHYVGWFSGLSEELHMLSRPAKASKMAQLAGGRVQLLQRSIEALEKGEYQWALELVSYVQLLSPYCETTRRVKTNILRILATIQTSAPGRNWYLTSARETAEQEDAHERAVSITDNSIEHRIKLLYHKTLQGGKLLSKHLIKVLGQKLNQINQTESIDMKSHSFRSKISDQLKVTKSQRNQCIRNLKSAVEIFNFIPVRMKAEAALNIDSVLSFTFTDTQQFTCIHFRRGVAYASMRCERQPDLEVLTTDKAWRSIISDELRPVVAVTTGKLRINSKDPLDYLRLKKLMSLVEIDME